MSLSLSHPEDTHSSTPMIRRYGYNAYHNIIILFRTYISSFIGLLLQNSVRVDVCVCVCVCVIHGSRSSYMGFRSVLFDVFKLCARRLIQPMHFRPDRKSIHPPRKVGRGSVFYYHLLWLLFIFRRRRRVLATPKGGTKTPRKNNNDNTSVAVQ